MKKKLYVAVVMNLRHLRDEPSVATSKRAGGEYASFVGYDKATVIQQAIDAKAKWESQPHTSSYTVLTGSLSEAVRPVAFELTPL